MDGILLDGRTGKLWTCSKTGGHVLGLLMRVDVNGRMMDQLLLFRHTVNIGEVEDHKTVALPEVKTIGFPEGTMHDIECEFCGQKRTWWMGQAALDRFLESRKRRRTESVEVSHVS